MLVPLTCFLLALVVLHPGPTVRSTVVEDFNHVERCKDSLYMGTPPRGILGSNLKKICQRYADKPRYVTLYDTKKRIPIYSAYTFKKTEGDRRVDYPWMYEPQVCNSCQRFSPHAPQLLVSVATASLLHTRGGRTGCTRIWNKRAYQGSVIMYLSH